MTDSPLKRLHQLGQSPWLDFIQRGLLGGGELARMIEQWGVSGMTSNPVIFNKAIAETNDYDADIARLTSAGNSAVQIYESLAFDDVRHAADLFRPVYDQNSGADGFVSLEVSPHLALDTAGTLSEAKRLWSALDRPNVMIKVPGTPEGLVAVRHLLAEGINVNVTLLFAVPRYREVLEAYLAGLEDALAANRPIERIASVASFFLSRIDSLIDRQLDDLAKRDAARRNEAAELRGEVAIASACSAYAVLREALESKRFQRLAAQGARAQRLLWASTGTKDPAYSDIKYVEPLVGPHTVNTMPLETLRAYNDHGDPANRLGATSKDAEQVLHRLSGLGIDLERATAQLLSEGIDKFVEPYDALLRKLEAARAAASARA